LSRHEVQGWAKRWRREKPWRLRTTPHYGQGPMLALTWLGFLRWLGALLLAIALVVAVVGLILYLWHVSGTGGDV
jgi:hypothetical protein